MRWDLSRLYASFDDPKFEADMQAYEARIAEAKALCGNTESVEGLCKLILCMREMKLLGDKLGNYVTLTLAADTNCTAALAPRQRLQELENEETLMESLFVAKVGAQENLDALLKQDELLSEHIPLFRNAKEKAKHLIDPVLEPTVLKMQLTGGASWMRLRDELFAGLTCDVELDGEKKRLPLTAVRAMACDPDAKARKAAYEAEIAAYPKLETGMAACLNGIKGEANTVAEMRGFDSVLDGSLAMSRMDRATLNALLDAMRASLPMFRRYFRLKNRLLGNEGGLKFYDLFAPVGGDARRYTLDEAKEVLLEVFGAAHKPIADVMRRAFEENLIDAYPREGKEGGAFCSGVPAIKRSYVLTNFDGSYSDVSTLAHELGHAYQDACLNEQSVLLDDLPMPLAETASTFNEILLSEKMLLTADAQAKIALLDQQIGDAAQVIVDILSRFLFESEVVEKRKTSALTAKELCEIMRDAQAQTYGDGLDPDCMHPYMWACKPHYYDTEYHFYNYPYAFGQLFASGLYALYLEKGADFWRLYDRLLRESGSGTVREVAASAGIDAADAAFWQGALKLYEDKLNQLEALAETFTRA